MKIVIRRYNRELKSLNTYDMLPTVIDSRDENTSYQQILDNLQYICSNGNVKLNSLSVMVFSNKHDNITVNDNITVIIDAITVANTHVPVTITEYKTIEGVLKHACATGNHRTYTHCYSQYNEDEQEEHACISHNEAQIIEYIDKVANIYFKDSPASKVNP